jgi:hypothetical protein
VVCSVYTVRLTIAIAIAVRVTSPKAKSGFVTLVMSIADWSLAKTTGIEAAIVVWPSAAGIPASIEARLALPVVCKAAVDAPVGSGNEAADIGSVD